MSASEEEDVEYIEEEEENNHAVSEEEEEYIEDEGEGDEEVEEEDDDEEGEEEEEEEEEDEEDEGETSEAEPSTKRQKVNPASYAVLVSRNISLQSLIKTHEETNVQAEKQIAKLKEENTALRKGMEGAEETIKSLRAAVSALSGSIGSAPLPLLAQRKLVLKFEEPIVDGHGLNDIPTPYRFSGVRSFPHGIDNNPRTSNRELQVEQRRPVMLNFGLYFKDNGMKATERDIDPSGLAPFKLNILYSDDMSKVEVHHFTKARVESLTIPKESVISTQNMCNGKLAFDFRLNFSSSETHPRNRQFIFEVCPTNDSPYVDDPDMCAHTPKFSVRSKTTAAKQAAPAAAAPAAAAAQA